MAKFWNFISSDFRRATAGGMAVVFGFLVPTLVTFCGLATDATFWMVARNRLQATTDGAAISAAHTIHLDGNGGGAKREADKVFSKAYGSEASDIVVEVANPPTSGGYSGNKNAVEVLSERRQTVHFARMVGMESVLTRSRSVAVVDAISDACLLALGPNVDKAIEITGSASVELACGIAANSSSNEAIYFSGSADVTASSVSTAGDIYQGGSSTVEVTDGSLRSHAPQIDDPYGAKGRNLQVPQLPTKCTDNNLSIKKSTTLSPGRYCGGIRFQGGTTTLSPGVYIIDAGDFNANAQASIVGEDVTIILTGSGNNYAQLNINGGANISLHAPKSGTDYDGVLFYQDREAPTFKGNNVAGNKLNGGSSFSLSGAVYFPSQALEFSGGASASIECLQLVGYTISFKGNSEVSSVCDETSGTEKISRLDIKLVE